MLTTVLKNALNAVGFMKIAKRKYRTREGTNSDGKKTTQQRQRKTYPN